MAFNWEQQIECADKQKMRREKCMLRHNKSFLAKIGKKKQS